MSTVFIEEPFLVSIDKLNATLTKQNELLARIADVLEKAYKSQLLVVDTDKP